MNQPQNFIVMIGHKNGITCSNCWNRMSLNDRVDLLDTGNPLEDLRAIPCVYVKNHTSDSLICDQCLMAGDRIATNLEITNEL